MNSAAMQAFLDTEIMAWSQSAEIVEAIHGQNARERRRSTRPDRRAGPRLAGRDRHRRDAHDRSRPAKRGGGVPAQPRRCVRRAHHRGVHHGPHGLNVAASAMTSDMWQGDEAKFTETYSIGAGAVHFSEVELDESTQRYQAQISLTIVDPASGEPIGAMTVGVDAEALL
jgi:hypothetical protein